MNAMVDDYTTKLNPNCIIQYQSNGDFFDAGKI